LGDSNFPHLVDDFVKGKKIKLFQNLYERYSNMSLSYSEDRPVAIRGLEWRLTQTFGGNGRYGVFSLYLHRCLLWKRAGTPLEPIEFPPENPIPSWSWMAVKGGIQYIDAPGTDVEWQQDIIWPDKFEDPEPSWVYLKDPDGSRPPYLEACIRNLDLEARHDKITFDDGRTLVPPSAKCVVVGKSKMPIEDSDKICYVLIVEPVCQERMTTWKRIGAGLMQSHHIALHESAAFGRIQ
jgi:hypothetical protein